MRSLRVDIFQDRKCVHVKLDKAVHAAMRAKMFQHNLSMQEVFDEFAKLLVTDDRQAVSIVEHLIMRKVKEIIDGKPKKPSKRDRAISELDADALYDLIEGQHSDENS